MDSQTLTTRTPDVRAFLRTLGKVLAVLGPIVLTIVAGYGSVKRAEGITQEKILALEADSRIQREKAITREEFNNFADWLREDTRQTKREIRDDISQIKKDVHAIRYPNRRENDH